MVAAAVRRGALAMLAASLLVALASRAPAQCVGDCAGDGEVTISDLILGVNIALGSQPLSACPAFANDDDEVDIAQLIRGVNNALEGCPPPAATATATGTSIASTPTHTAPATATRTNGATATATHASTATHTAIPTGTATATITQTAIPTGTATATVTVTVTQTAIPTGTATATLTLAPTETATALPTGTATATAIIGDTATPTPSATPSQTSVPPGEQLASRAAFVSAGLGGIHTLVAAVIAAVTNDGDPPLLAAAQVLPPAIQSAACPVSGNTFQSCTEVESFPQDPIAVKSISAVLGAEHCVMAGRSGGTFAFDGSIDIDSVPGVLTSCRPLAFTSAAFDVNALTVEMRDPTVDIVLTVMADLDGSVGIGGLGGACLVTSLVLEVNGTMTSMLPDGVAVETTFFDTGVTMTNITFNADCVPVAYTLTFNGDVAFTPMQGALLEVSAPLTTISGSVLPEQVFDVTFVNFSVKQDATTSPVQVEMDGVMTSSCFGGQLLVDTVTPLAVAAGELCPSSGSIAVTGGGNSMATVSYDAGAVTITPQGGEPTNYPSCITAELLMCVPA